MDVYLDEDEGEIFDIEPDKNDGEDDIASLPRRVRFCHAKIDAGNLATGEDNSKFRNVLVIFKYQININHHKTIDKRQYIIYCFII